MTRGISNAISEVLKQVIRSCYGQTSPPMYWFQPPIPPTPTSTELRGKSITVTGANTGLGFEAARQLLRLRTSTLVLAVCNPTKGLSARTALLADPLVRSINPPPTVLVYELDLSPHRSVIAFVHKVTTDLPALNVLLLNGRINMTSWTLSPSTRNEMVFQVNFLSNALSSILLLPFRQNLRIPIAYHLRRLSSPVI
jgi:NAD(P)-dependent dehydrogenase (short-subunit alcohol dehydrogenase family)